jgi:hypothetical protein
MNLVRMTAWSHRITRAQFGSSLPGDKPLSLTLSNFYREEFIKCQRCLDQQRDHFSARAVADLERALTRVMSHLDRLCAAEDTAVVVGRLLRQFDVVAGQAV